MDADSTVCSMRFGSISDNDNHASVYRPGLRAGGVEQSLSQTAKKNGTCMFSQVPLIGI
jgi:hypothetical protein